MALKKCPKCELNYIKDGEALCNICEREIRRGLKEKPAEEEPMLCSECGEAPAVRGGELCAECLREQKRQAELESAIELDEAFDEAVADDEPEEEPEE
ncbi:MAG: hypothetical protein Q4C13_02920 [Clostridia bacterium]|nr:hypothetical protein [Clostridia bacterium]